MDMINLMKSMNDPNWEFYVPKEEMENVDIKGYKFGLRRLNGRLLPQLCKNMSVVKSMEVKEDDTFVVTYPKSGKTQIRK